MGKVLVVQPFIGEFGWEVFSWQPLIRSVYLAGGFDRCIVYSARGGDSLLYRFAEVRKFPHPIPPHEAECMVWHAAQDRVADINAIIEQTAELARTEFGKDVAIFTLQQIERLNYPYWERGQPDLLKSDVVQSCPDKQVAICIRDRELSNYRNSPPEIWLEAARLMVAAGIRPCLVGKTQVDGAWDGLALPDGVVSVLNRTTIDDLIRFFYDIGRGGGLAVGGLTGSIHLASRCACPHLVYGNDKCVDRCAATNWFGARHRVITEWGWEPKPEEIAALCIDYFAGKVVLV